MGQYYKACLISPTEDIKVISPKGWKLMEHSWYWNPDMCRVEKLLSEKHYRVIWVWDYSQCAAFAWESNLKPEKERCEEYEEWEILEHKDGKVYYLVNHSCRQYINMTQQEHDDALKDQWEWVVHPLSLLCRADAESAGWDYHSDINQHLLGLWCWDEISVLEVDSSRDEEFKYFEYQNMTDVYFFKE